MATHTADPEPDEIDRAGELPPHVVDGLLASRRRRRSLRLLREAEEPVVVGDLAERLAGSEADPRRVRAELYQCHLPRLTATGVVAFDSLLGTVEFTGGPRLTARLDGERPEICIRAEDK
ncbi:hypothetical protein BV210_14840 [Halorientalis sp. IM1011]|uniref:DUF7344 domain-containing protein n=1 Tax=Halorientalis sp. IM1011 TaxID=1932360 RepID=UPI00097CD09A|nr:hypothetical protein [Halorientalis sp. IM1011]AQL43901.1 hypothetical protein BV210_14840 [Halorientalis sp. IM1011]